MKNFLIDSLKSIPEYLELLKQVETKNSIYLHGLIKESMPHLAYSLHKHSEKPLVFVVENEKEGRRVYDQIRELEEGAVDYFPSMETSFFEIRPIEDNVSKQRLKVLNRCIRKEPFVLVTTLKALLRPLQKKKTFEKMSFEINLDQEIEIEEIQEVLVNLKYEKNSMVEAKGEFAIRGGIIDIFPVSMENPVRIELFGDEIDSMRIFDVSSQKSIENIDSFRMGPSKELILDDKMRKTIIEGIQKDIEKIENSANIYGRDLEKTVDKFTNLIAALEEGLRIENIDLIMPYLKKKDYDNFTSYLDKDTLIFFEDLVRIYDGNKMEWEQFLEDYTYQLQEGEVFESHEKMLLPGSKIIEEMKAFTTINSTSLLKRTRLLNPQVNLAIKSIEAPSFNKDLSEMVRVVEDWSYRGYKTVILADSKGNGEMVYDLLAKENIPVALVDSMDSEIKSGQVFISLKNSASGFEYPKAKFVFITHKEIYGKQRIKQHRRKRRASSRDLMNYTDLSIGDYVVHEHHGIGEYRGVNQIEVDGIKKDYLVLKYRGTDKLFIPTDQMDLVQKYIGNEERKPSLNKLGGTEWIRAKAKVKKSVDEMAQDLIELYAKRSELKGFPFPEDTPWQREFEESFIYEETYSQLRSIDEIKKDMESDKPMDRLLCGDVGYGKTEVAIRAAFKAIMGGKQVAFLVPTTILAQQHYYTIQERFKNFPARVEVLSRFRTPSQQKATIEGLRTGVVDMVMGTHRILSKKIKFKDIGLLIIDEEQRFGVRQKEQIKKMKENVDVLTLSATPIPRTLQMGLVGIRDLSVLEEAPEERYPTTSYVLEFEPTLIKEAIEREMDRGGQVYFVYNRVQDIDEIYGKLQDLVPDAKIAVGHGQMQEKVLEQIMLEFSEGNYDILLSTTIIETGLDIQNVNTLIVYNSDRMGLSQLYQLKGRIGRGERSSFAYFTYQKGKSLQENAEKRLMAIKDFTELGSGYKIAMRDLELRGAGNILGESQSGHVTAIGYDLYAKFLEEAVREAKGEKIESQRDIIVEVQIDAYIPSTYIESQDEKIDMYKKIASIRNEEDLEEVIEELVDRYGDVPRSVLNLMKIALLKSYAGRAGFNRVREHKERLHFYLEDFESFGLEKIGFLSEEFGDRISFDLGKDPNINLDYKDGKLDQGIELLESILAFNKDLNE